MYEHLSPALPLSCRTPSWLQILDSPSHQELYQLVLHLHHNYGHLFLSSPAAASFTPRISAAGRSRTPPSCYCMLLPTSTTLAAAPLHLRHPAIHRRQPPSVACCSDTMLSFGDDFSGILSPFLSLDRYRLYTIVHGPLGPTLTHTLTLVQVIAQHSPSRWVIDIYHSHFGTSRTTLFNS